MNLPILPTTVVGSYSMPAWLERLKTEYALRKISKHDLDELHNSVTKAAIKDQEVAGLDAITDGELRRAAVPAGIAAGAILQAVHVAPARIPARQVSRHGHS